MAAIVPTQAGFLAFIRQVMGINSTILPDNSWAIPYAYDIAFAIVYRPMACASPLIYQQAVYNLGGSNLLNFAPDLSGAAVVDGSDPPLPYFAYLRQKFQINSFVSGVIQSASDEGTSESMVVPKPAEEFTLADLQYLKDPYGRQYLAFAQRSGTLWGLS